MMNRTFKMMLVLVDAGLLLYWGAVLLGLIPEEMRFKDYDDPVVEAWNWSFFPLDLLAVAAGCWGVYLTGKGRRLGEAVLMVGLTLTFCAGFMAISFWAYYGDFTLGWWVPNIVLMLVPCYLCKRLVCGKA